MCVSGELVIRDPLKLIDSASELPSVATFFRVLIALMPLFVISEKKYIEYNTIYESMNENRFSIKTEWSTKC